MNLRAATHSPAVASLLGRHLARTYLGQSRVTLHSSTCSSGSVDHRSSTHKLQQLRKIHASTPRRQNNSTTASKSTTSDTVRRLMRHVPHPVAIVTAAPLTPPDNEPHASHWRGATISSFVTVALDPEPVVCFNIKHDSSTFAALQRSAHFNVHILRSGAEAEAVASKFASGNALEPFHDGEGELEWWVREPVGRQGSAPVIVGARSEVEEGGDAVVSFRLSCAHMAEKTVAVGDHVVVFGRVVDVVYGFDGGRDGGPPQPPCLLYVGGGYSRVANR